MTDIHLLRRFAVICTILVVYQGITRAQPTIIGPATGVSGQTLSYQLQDQGKAVAGVTWTQGLNPDRYSGNDYATSFKLTIKPQGDGSVQIVAPWPGRYRLVGAKGSAAAQAAILIRPSMPVLPIRGLDFWTTNRGWTSSDAVRAEASKRLALVKHMGLNWVNLVDQVCMEIGGPTPVIVRDVNACGSIQPADLEWIIAQAHTQGYSVALGGGVLAMMNGTVLSDLQLSFPGMTDAQLLTIQQAYSQFHLAEALEAQKTGSEALIVGPNWQTPYPSSQALYDSINAGWNTLIQQLRDRFSGQLWFGWATPCASWDSPDWSKVDGSFIFAMTKSSGVLCEYPRVTGYSNLLADDMYIGVTDFSDSRLRGFQKSVTDKPRIWSDFYPNPIDSVSWNPSVVWSEANPLDTQEIVDQFESTMTKVPGTTIAGFLPWVLGLREAGGRGNSLLAYPTFVHAAANWWGGDPNYFDGCLAPQSPDVLFKTVFNGCPLARYQLWLWAGEDVLPASDDPSLQVLNLTGGGAFLLDT